MGHSLEGKLSLCGSFPRWLFVAENAGNREGWAARQSVVSFLALETSRRRMEKKKAHDGAYWSQPKVRLGSHLRRVGPQYTQAGAYCMAEPPYRGSPGS